MANGSKPKELTASGKPRPINIRKALAGLYLLQGRGSLKRCLIDAGYSRATARNAGNEGLQAETCIEESAKLDSKANPANLLETARRRAAAAFEAIDPKTAPLRDVVRMLETSEKYFGGHAIAPGNASLELAERLAGISALLAVARERGLTPVATRTPTLDYVNAEKVETTPLLATASDNV